jgi:hypothetical protein
MSRQLALTACLLMLLSVIAGSGCRNRKLNRGKGADSTSVVSGKKMFAVEAFDFTYFTARAKTVYSSGDKDIPFTLSIKMEKDKKILISATAILGIEAARILITTDSVFVLDRLHRCYIATDYSYIKQLTKTSVKDLNIGMLQSIFLGNNTIAEKDVDLADTLDGFNILRSVSKGYENTVYINPKLTKIEINWVKDVLNGQELKVSYSDLRKEDGQMLPHEVLIYTSTAKDKAEARLTYDNISLEKIESFSFSIPSSYNVCK